MGIHTDSPATAVVGATMAGPVNRRPWPTLISAIQHFAAGGMAGILLSVALTFEVLFLSLTGTNELGGLEYVQG